jgi:hypothetical protein
MEALLEAQKKLGEGDCATSWFTSREYEDAFVFSIHKPCRDQAIIAFDLVRHGAMAD